MPVLLIRVHFNKSPFQCLGVETELHKVCTVGNGEIEDALGAFARTVHEVDASEWITTVAPIHFTWPHATSEEIYRDFYRIVEIFVHTLFVIARSERNERRSNLESNACKPYAARVLPPTSLRKHF